MRCVSRRFLAVAMHKMPAPVGAPVLDSQKTRFFAIFIDFFVRKKLKMSRKRGINEERTKIGWVAFLDFGRPLRKTAAPATAPVLDTPWVHPHPHPF